MLGELYVDYSLTTAKKWRAEAMASKITCLVTLHGIGFEQSPQAGVDNSGYADPLHQHLKKCLEEKLSDDPNRERINPGDNGAIYVESRWLDDKGIASREEGLKRLGVWRDDKLRVDTNDALLVADDAKDGSVSHIALVYSNLEPMGPEIGAALVTLGTSLFAASHYGSASGLIHMALADGLAMIGHHTAPGQEPISSRPRADLGSRSVKQLGQHGLAAPAPSPGLLAALRTLEDDVACYVCHNEERERVRSFVYEALMRLACREDVDSIVLNTHSNGTVVAFDVIRHLPEEAIRKIKAFVTAGSPLRKYVDLFHWGRQIQTHYPFEPWYNFWDRRDPVADPLDPPISWRLGDKIVPSVENLFSRIDLNSEKPFWIKVDDREVDNVEKSLGGGLQAHNYWDNEEQFVAQLADIVGAIAGTLLVKAA
jgi:hypothetical protein